MKRPSLSLLLLATITIFLYAISKAISISDVSFSNTTIAPIKKSNESHANDQASSNNSTIARQSNVKRTRDKSPRQVGKLSRPLDTSKLNRQNGASSSPAKPTNQDPFALAQQQARLMIGYKNTPPLFLIPTRDFYVDVMHYPLGAKLTTIHAIDQDGDAIEYSLRPGRFNDASAYFSIDPLSGELKLANKQFPYYSDQSQIQSKSAAEDETKTEDNEEISKTLKGDESGDEDEETPVDHDYLNKNLYFINVVAFDGRYHSNIELQIHVINSSLFAGFQSISSGGLPVQLTSDESHRAIEQMESMIRRKTGEFYDKLHKVPSTNNTSKSNSSIVVYPNFINPSLSRPDELEMTTIVSLPNVSNNLKIHPIAFDQPQEPIISTEKPTAAGGRGQSNVELLPDRQQVESMSPQPMIVSLVVACSFLTIALVLLMFIVPISVKRLRKRLKHVELQHEHLSQQTSNGSSTVCSSSSHSYNPSWFTLSSDQSCVLSSDSSVCRKSSLDSTTTNVSQPTATFNRVNNGLIANPVYLQHQQANLIDGNPHHVSLQTQNNPSTQVESCHNVYYPIDDDFYSTINTENTVFGGMNQQPLGSSAMGIPHVISGANSNNCLIDAGVSSKQEIPARAIESPVSDSGSSTRSLARFLSLPARHSSHQSNLEELEDSELPKSCKTHNQVMTSKTISRTCNISREQALITSNNWEIERYKLRFLNILDEGQFGLVFRCKLKCEDSEQTVAVKTLKSSASKNNQDREELLAEIDIMKLVCQHSNVVKILHCCTSDIAINENTPLLVMEYVEQGKLQSFLEKSRINHHYTTSWYKNIQATSDHLTSQDLVKFIYHVAKGMEYVSSRCIVHRDLASRNILVSSQRICKIGDFGMARHMNSDSGVYERHSRNTKVPVRWMAPEVLLNNSFTTKSDVFSFGILMWEIVTLGSTPYRHLKTEQVIDEVARRGERPIKPEYCHSELYKIMSKCWSQRPEERPTFRSLVHQLDELLMTANDYIELDQYPTHNYYNIPITAAPFELL